MTEPARDVPLETGLRAPGQADTRIDADLAARSGQPEIPTQAEIECQLGAQRQAELAEQARHAACGDVRVQRHVDLDLGVVLVRRRTQLADRAEQIATDSQRQALLAAPERVHARADPRRLDLQAFINLRALVAELQRGAEFEAAEVADQAQLRAVELERDRAVVAR
jgi:hypothetical protein